MVVKLYPCSLVFAASHKVCPVLTELEIGDNVHVCPLIVQHFIASLDVEERHLARLVAGDDQTGCVCESADGRF